MTPDSRMKKDIDPARADRTAQDRVITEDRELTDDERLEAFRDSFSQAVLPDLPNFPGFKTCWLTTNNPRDSVISRLRLGYVLIRPAECPGWVNNSFTVKTNDYGDCIGINEMLAAKVPESLWQRYMTEVHHTQPMNELRKLAETADRIKAEARRDNKALTVEEDDGLTDVRETLKKAELKPHFN